MLIELLGLPGAGKSTLLRALVPALRSAGLSAGRVDKIVGLESADPNAPRYLKRGPDRTTLYRTLAFRRDHQALMDHVERKLELSPPDAFLFSWTTNLYEVAREHRDHFDFAFLDEGFIHRGVSAHLTAGDALFDAYLALTPLPDLILHLCPPPRMAFRRAIQRRADKSFSKRKVQAKLGDRFTFRQRHRLIETGLAKVRARGAEVIEVNTADEIDACLASLLPQLQALHARGQIEATAAQ